MMFDHFNRPRVIYVAPDAPSHPNSLVFAAGVFCGVLAAGASILLWALA